MLTIGKILSETGRYVQLMSRVLTRPDRMRMFLKQYVTEMFQLGYNSIGIVLIISFFIGMVICLQIKLNIQSPWMPRMVVGYTSREIILLEYSSSIICLILAGKVGSNIASELGTMRITQQIDALDIMGVNSANYLILPKIAGLMTIMPILVTFSVTSGIIGSYATTLTGITNVPELDEGFRYSFTPWFFWCGMIKAVVYAFLITSISAYKGYTVQGGSVEVGISSTDAVVVSSIMILFADIFLTNILT
ncbi:MAG: ABC transporter permease [Bacteroidaceae bacterium]|nr:ABC transporter permease [Bacteroidaceae bacterium]